MLVYKEYLNAGVSIFISHITIFTFATNVFCVLNIFYSLNVFRVLKFFDTLSSSYRLNGGCVSFRYTIQRCTIHEEIISFFACRLIGGYSLVHRIEKLKDCL